MPAKRFDDIVQIQAVLFDKDLWSLNDSHQWFHSKGFTMPKDKEVHVTENYIRYRVVNPNYKKYIYRIKDIGKGINFILAIPKN